MQSQCETILYELECFVMGNFIIEYKWEPDALFIWVKYIPLSALFITAPSGHSMTVWAKKHTALLFAYMVQCSLYILPKYGCMVAEYGTFSDSCYLAL